VAVLNFQLLAVELSLDDAKVSLELLMQAAQARILKGDELVNMD
jgi:hypothetical protein